MVRVNLKNALFYELGKPMRVVAHGSSRASFGRKNTVLVIALIALIAFSTKTEGGLFVLMGMIIMMVVLVQLIMIVVNVYKSRDRNLGYARDALAVFGEFVVVNSHLIDRDMVKRIFIKLENEGDRRRHAGVGFVIEKEGQRDARIYWLNQYKKTTEFFLVLRETFGNVRAVGEDEFFEIWEENRTASISPESVTSFEG